MTIAPETQAFAERLVLAESNMRKAAAGLSEDGFNGRPIAPWITKLRRAQHHASRLPKLLYAWTASEEVQTKLACPDHIDHACFLAPILSGQAHLARALVTAEGAGGNPAKIADAIDHLTNALTDICDKAHVPLRDLCTKHKIDKPEFSTTRGGGGR